MAIPMFLAVTGAEWQYNQALSEQIAWMACHFSPYGAGLSNRPRFLPPGSMLIVNDRTPVCSHDPDLIAMQVSEMVSELACSAVLLDFQRPDELETAAITEAILQICPCPAAVTHYYAQNTDCAVFLPPVPPNVPLVEYLTPWQGREIWLEAALDGIEITITADGTHIAPLLTSEPESAVHLDKELHCHYNIIAEPCRICFRLYRTPEDIRDLLTSAEELGVKRAVGLYQEFYQ
jgi:hypothetical protein